MIYFVLGTPNSGKSDVAENLIDELSGNKNKIYLATMLPQDEDAIVRIDKHRRKREGKSFVTIECPYDLRSVETQINELSPSVCLLECISNLAANEMFEKKRMQWDLKELTDIVVDEVEFVANNVESLVVVSNDFSKFVEESDEESKKYIELTSEINRRLRLICDKYYFVADGKTAEYENR